MIEIGKNSNPQGKRREYLLFIDGELWENAYPNFTADHYCQILSKDNITSRKIAAHSLTDLPQPVDYVNLYEYPSDIEHLDKRHGTWITNHVEVDLKARKTEVTDKYHIGMVLGNAALSEWQSPYSFVDYAYEMFKILKVRDDLISVDLINTDHDRLNRERKTDDEGYPYDVEIDISEIDRGRVTGLELIFPYSSSELTIADEVGRVSKIIREAHNRVVGQLASRVVTSPLEIRKIEGSRPPKYQLFINGFLLEGAEVDQYTERHSDGPFWVIHMMTQEAFNRLAGIRFCDIPDKVVGLNLKFNSELLSRSELIIAEAAVRIKTPQARIYTRVLEKPSPYPDDFSISFFCSLNVNNWRGDHSPHEYDEAISKAIYNAQDVNCFFPYESPGDYNFNVVFRVVSPQTRIFDEVFRCRNYLRILFEETEDKLASASRPKSLTESFNFPKELAVPCEQYLLYFVQFLRDLGVEATSELKHEAGRVLFTVIPKDQNEALHKIRTALDEYLHLPFSPVSSDSESETAILRLESNVLRLQSDLKLAVAELQAKNATIEAQQLTISFHQTLLRGGIVNQPLEVRTPNSKEEDREELLGGTVALTVFKKGGLEVSYAKILRRLRELFAKKE